MRLETTKDFTEHFKPLMIQYHPGGICKECWAWIPQYDSFNKFATYEKHLDWHRRIDGDAVEAEVA